MHGFSSTDRSLQSQNHRIVWIGKDHKDHIIPAPQSEVRRKGRTFITNKL